MKIIDANVVLRYLLKDNQSLFEKSVQIVENNEILLTHVIIAEIVYVLEKVYKIPKKEIYKGLTELFSSVSILINDKQLILLALKNYSEHNIDFADAILLSYKRIKNYNVITFDKKLNKLLV
jgi:predicted nucleic-acid-binding protein